VSRVIRFIEENFDLEGTTSGFPLPAAEVRASPPEAAARSGHWHAPLMVSQVLGKQS
jgi:hypothetical protein